MKKTKPPSAATLRKYGLTRKDWRRMCRKCNHTCVLCGEKFGKRLLAIDHEHIKGFNAYKRRKAKSSGRSVRVRVMSPEIRKQYVRGILHNYCNRFVRKWLTLERARSIVAYLESYHNKKRK